MGFIFAALFIWQADPTPVSFLLGAAIMIFGEAVRFISAGTLVKFEGVTDTGIYSAVRNPLYVGSFLVGAGALVMGRNIVFTILFLILYPAVYWYIIRREERYLVGRYGDEYLRYLDTVPRIVPRRLPLGEIFSRTAPFLAVKNRELKAVTGVLAIWGVMLVKIAFL